MTLKRKLVFRDIKLKLLTNASISCLSHSSMSITTWFMSVFAIACLRKITHFLIFTGLCEKLQYIKLWKFAVFYTSRGTSSLPTMNKIRDGRVFSLVHLTWNDPDTKKKITPQLDVIWRNWHHFRTQDIDFHWNNLFSMLPQNHDTNYNWCKFCIFTHFCTKQTELHHN
jgi:hypothetical protein